MILALEQSIPLHEIKETIESMKLKILWAAVNSDDALEKLEKSDVYVKEIWKTIPEDILQSLV